jgi:hypothetical protein
MTLQEQYTELSFYTLSHRDPSFIHQHIVDAYFAQTADANTKPICIVFALVGLYLFIERNYTGKQIQQIHTQMAKNKKTWPSITLPADRGNIHVADVLTAPPGAERDAMIRTWCASVWAAYQNSRETIRAIS